MVLFVALSLLVYSISLASSSAGDDIGPVPFLMTVPILAAIFYWLDEPSRRGGWANRHPVPYFLLAACGAVVVCIILFIAILRVAWMGISHAQ